VNATAVTIFSASLQSAQPLACRLFEAALSRGKVANAYLLVGRDSSTKLELARQVAAYANCEGARGSGRGSCLVTESDKQKWCNNCKWIDERKHPQAWIEVSGEGKSQKIPVEKIRTLTEELGKTSTFVRVVIVPDASEGSFHRPAANALLKSIEEPPPNCLFFFFADSTDDVLATIVSRCQAVPMNAPMQLGYWKGNDALLDATRAQFIQIARKQFGNAYNPTFLSNVSTSLDLGKQIKEVLAQLEGQIEEFDAAERLLDLFVACEIEVLKEHACEDAKTARYISRVSDLAEKCKRQIRDYVKAANAIDSFVLGLNELRSTEF
jgi:hypothetical protein